MSEWKLFEVEVKKTIYVRARNEREATKNAEANAREDGGRWQTWAAEVTELCLVPQSRHDSLPHGGPDDEEKTIAECFEAHRLAHKLRDPKFYTARTKRVVNSLTVERGPKGGAA